MMTQLSILGTGWLGLPLTKALVQQGYTVKGATTSNNKLATLQEEGVLPYQIKLTEEKTAGDIGSFLAGSQILVINIPPGLRRNPKGDFAAKIQQLLPYIEKSTIQNVLFIGSTSVFEDQEGFPIITAKTLPNASSNAGKQLIETEKLLQASSTFTTTVLRFAGLYDERRHPATMLSKRKGIKNPKAPVNLIHLEDCLGIIQKIIQMEAWGITLNAASPSHPKKVNYYSTICKRMGLPLPDYDYDTPSKGKCIAATTVEESLHYTFSKVPA